ncbi:hypothetical protein L6452_32580 [Arctium lappa]|uniref:Uncharacterized protein n=1 Tax=Arctium lappa TaxID=4217 RepID=A0ACB8Z579_ARCLA|nr:hypothetical protein L6452_32580 [Arctium lappa]
MSLSGQVYNYCLFSVSGQTSLDYCVQLELFVRLSYIFKLTLSHATQEMSEHEPITRCCLAREAHSSTATSGCVGPTYGRHESHPIAF